MRGAGGVHGLLDVKGGRADEGGQRPGRTGDQQPVGQRIARRPGRRDAASGKQRQKTGVETPAERGDHDRQRPEIGERHGQRRAAHRRQEQQGRGGAGPEADGVSVN